MIAYWIICSCFSWWITGSENMTEGGEGLPLFFRALLSAMGPITVFAIVLAMVFCYEDQK